MATTALDVQVTIDLNAAPKAAGFGYPLIVAKVSEAESVVDYTELSSLAELAALLNATGDEPDATHVKVLAAATLMLMQDHAPAKFEVCISTAKCDETITANAKEGWRQVIAVTAGATGDSTVSEVAAAVNALSGKLFFTDCAPTDDLTACGKRTIGFAYPARVVDEPDVPAVPVAALVGATAGRDPGSFTYKNLILYGLTGREGVTGISDSNLNSHHIITVVTKEGSCVTTDGCTVTGDFIDLIDSEDYLTQQIAYRTQQVLNSNDKIPYDNGGIAILENVALEVLQSCYMMGMIATNEDGEADYSVNYGLRSESTASERAARNYPYGRFTATLSGAVHNVAVVGTVEF